MFCPYLKHNPQQGNFHTHVKHTDPDATVSFKILTHTMTQKEATHIKTCMRSIFRRTKTHPHNNMVMCMSTTHNVNFSICMTARNFKDSFLFQHPFYKSPLSRGILGKFYWQPKRASWQQTHKIITKKISKIGLWEIWPGPSSAALAVHRIHDSDSLKYALTQNP